MRTAIAILAALAVTALPILTPTVAAASSTADTLQCVQTNGSSFLSGDWVKVRCTGTRFKTSAHKYRAVIVCDRALWYDDVTKYGPWTYNAGTSTAACDSIADLGAIRRYYQFT